MGSIGATAVCGWHQSESSAIQLNWTGEIDLTSGATDADADTIFKARIESGPSNGELIFKNDKLVRWVPREAFTGTDTFIYSVFDGYQWSDPKTVTVTVTPDPNLINPTPGVGVFKLGTTAPPNAEDEPGACGDLSKVANPAEGYATHPITSEIYDKYLLYKSYLESDFFGLFLAGYTSDEAIFAMKHYFDNSGTTVNLNVQKLLSDSDAARDSWDASLVALIAFIEEKELVGTIHLAETKSTLGSTGGSVWEKAVGQFTAWTMTDVVGTITDDGNISYSVSVHYNIWDPYDWVSTRAGLQGELAEMHMQGLTKQFIQEGSLDKEISWEKGNSPGPPAP